VLSKYQSKGFAVVAINCEESEDDMVLPLLKNNGYGFVPLKGSWKWAADNYGVQGTPANFLLDGGGRIYFKPREIYDAASQKQLEHQVEALLARADGK